MLSEEDLHVQVPALALRLMFCICYLSSAHFFPFFAFALRSEKEEVCDLKNYKIKAQNEKKKREILSSMYTE